MHIVLISGSHRNNSESARVSHYLDARLKALKSGVTTDIIDLAGNPLPLWDESAWNPESSLTAQFKPYAERLAKADGFVVVVPEWAGMVPAGMKNFMLYTHESNVGHKPGLLVGVSSTRGGTYPVSEMRLTSAKNNKLLYLPEHLIVRDAGQVFKGDTAANPDDDYIRGRSDFALNILLGYSEALKPLRESGVLFNKKYPFGM